MPWPKDTRRISDEEWDIHRLDIINLYQHHTLGGDDGVIARMKGKGFAATPAQYESRLKSWGVRKYNKKAEPRRAKIKAQRTRHPETAQPRQEAESGLQRIASSQNMQFPEEDNIVDLDFDAMELVNFNLEPSGPSNCFDFTDLDEFNLTPLGCNDLSFNWSPEIDSLFLARSLPALQLGGMIVKSVYDKVLATSTSSTLTRISDFNFLYEFSNCVTEVTSFSSMGATPIPHRFYSEGDRTGEDSSQLRNIPAVILNAARFDRRLIASIINGFEGLENISHIGVLKFLQKHPAMQEELFKCFDNQSSPVVKSFAENFFPICVESDNIEVVKFLINKKLVDANKTVCFSQGERYTPLQYAAIHQSFRVVKYLITLADVNKSFSQARGLNAINLLIRHGSSRRSTLDENFLELVNAFLEKKASISMELYQMLFEGCVDEQIIGRLLENITGRTLHTLLSQKNLFGNITSFHKGWNLKKTIELFNSKCRDLGGDLYLYQFHQQVDVAFRRVVNYGYDDHDDSADDDSLGELIRIMLPYTSSPHKALQMAKKAKNQAAVRLIQEDLKINPGSEGVTEDSNTIISALESKDQNLLRGLEKRGVFDRLRGHKFGQVLTAALWARNEEYTTKLVALDPDFNFCALPGSLNDGRAFDISSALEAALVHDFHDIAWKLLSIGLVSPKGYDASDASLLYVAVNAKNLGLVKTIIEFSFDSRLLTCETWPVLESAIELGQDSIFDHLWKACPSSFRPTTRLLKLALEKGRKNLFFDIIKSTPENHDFRKVGLQAAVECEDESLFDELISLGVRADDDEILGEAIREYPSMVKPLLDRYWKAYPQGRTGYGNPIIWSALQSYPTPYQWVSLDEVVTWNLLNPNHLLQTSNKQHNLLLGAIKTCDYAIVEKFITAGSNVKGILASKTLNTTTALLAAIETEIEQIVQLLLNNKANVNEPARPGIQRTPLQKAAEVNSISIVNLLLNHGADVNAPPAVINGATALQFAAIHGNCDMASTLIRRGARADIPPPRGLYGRWPLEGAAENGRFDMIEFLWNAFGSLLEEQCQSAMRRAERNGHIGCKERIQELMATPNLSSTMALEPYEWVNF